MHQLVTIANHQRSYALLSTSEDTETAVVFVHGFFGDSYTTWQEFQVLIDECENKYSWCRRADLYFFEYQAASNYIGVSADNLRRFIVELFPTPPETLFCQDLAGVDWAIALRTRRLKIRGGPYHYRHLVLVGHSLGGLVIRKLVHAEAKRLRDLAEPGSLDRADHRSDHPILSASVRLISPAHLGFRPGGPAGALYAIMNVGAAIRAILTCYRAFVELQPGCGLLNTLQAETEQFAQDYPTLPALCADILWADREDIVVAGEYACDHAPLYPHANTNHISVCKPVRSYLFPLLFVGESAKAHGRG